MVAFALTLGASPGAGTPQSERPDPGRARRLAKLDRGLQSVLKAQRRDHVRVIVRTNASSHAWIANDIATRGGHVGGFLTSVSGMAASVPADQLPQLADDPAVESISTDAVVTSAGLPSSDALFATLPRPGGGLSGAQVTVAVVDSGIEPNADFGRRVVGFFDFTQGGIPRRPFDDYGHGTHVAGLIAGRETGVAPGARLIGLKVLDANGSGYTSDVIRALDFLTANHRWLGVQIVNLSLGHPILESAANDPLVQAVEAATRAGLVVVVSAGNYGRRADTGVAGYAGITSPGNAPSAITVGSLDTQGTPDRQDDCVADYSSRGPTWYDAAAKPDIVAPGHALTSVAATKGSLYANHPGARVAGGNGAAYMRLSGTSLATAVASGTIALMIEANRQLYRQPLTPNAVKAALQWSAIGVEGADALTQGAGGLNAAGAVAIARAVDTTRATGSRWLVGVLPQSTTIDSVPWSWGQTVVWGNAVLSGQVMTANQPAWARTVVWGNTIVWGSAVGWGTDVVWEDASVWSSTVVWGNALVGTTNGATVVWGNTSVTPLTVVWGNLAMGSIAPAAHSLVGPVE